MNNETQRKTKVCVDCGDKKVLEDFPNQSNYNESKRHYSGDSKRTDCKECHGKKNRAALLRNTTPEQRRIYMREYMRNYRK